VTPSPRGARAAPPSGSTRATGSAPYRGVTLATPNESEAAAAAGLEAESERDLERIAARIVRAVRPQHLIVTRGRDGLTLWSGRAGASLAAHGGAEAVDVTGRGDAVVATATLALAAGAPALEAAALANVAGQRGGEPPGRGGGERGRPAQGAGRGGRAAPARGGQARRRK
jgi:sugar/nucleoside kinase (ribokinase family)